MGNIAGCFDGHAHVFHRDLPMAPNRRYAPQSDASLEAYDALLRSCGLDGGILVQPSSLGSDNGFLFDTLNEAARFPDLTFKRVVVFDPYGEAWQTDLETAEQAGIIGIRRNLVGAPDQSLDLNPWHHILEAVARRGWHVELHCEGERFALDTVREPAGLHRGFGLAVRMVGTSNRDPRVSTNFPTQSLQEWRIRRNPPSIR
ncbi:MAG: amidohydrolase family protein [Pseudomonadota bacterium]